MPSLRITYRSSVYAGSELTLNEPVIRIGRDPSCHVRFDEEAERAVSRHHAEIRWGSTGPVVFPSLGRIVLLHDKQLSAPTPLQPGDLLVLAGPGGPALEVHFDPWTARAVTPSESSAGTEAQSTSPGPTTSGEATLDPGFAAQLEMMREINGRTKDSHPPAETKTPQTKPQRTRVMLLAVASILTLVGVAIAWLFLQV